MGAWATYFLGEAWLHYRGHLRLDVLLNLALASLVAVPLPARLARHRLARVARQVIAALGAMALLWYEAWFTSATGAAQLYSEAGGLPPIYAARLVADAVDRWDLAALAAIVAGCLYLGRRITLTPVAFAAILSVLATGAGQEAAPGERDLQAFFEAEAARTVRFGERPPGGELDLVVVHVCSLSWSDLRAAGLDAEALLRPFDLVLTRFNSVSSYTNPSALRLLRAACGQPRHRDLYLAAPPECYLLDALRAQGYATWSAVDNDAPSFRFVQQITALGHADPPIGLEGLPIRRHDFDGTPIYDDLALLERWWTVRQGSPARRAALYVDVTTLHGGARRVDDPGWWRRSRAELYREAAQELFAGLDRFVERLRASGGRFVLVLVPEHGAALRGSRLQPPDLRDLPLPAITTVPVAIKLIGPGLPAVPARQRLVSRPTSYLALAWLVRSLVEAPAFGPEAMLTPEVLAAVPETSPVSENEAAVVSGLGEKLLLGKGGKWLELTPETAGE